MIKVLELLDPSNYRKSTNMMGLPARNGYRSEVLMLIEDTIASISTELEGDYRGG